MLLHALDDDLRTWDEVVPHLVERFRVVRRDYTAAYVARRPRVHVEWVDTTEHHMHRVMPEQTVALAVHFLEAAPAE